MTYREAITEAIRQWRDIWFHWGKSQQSTAAVGLLEFEQRNALHSRYDDDLKKAVDWFMGWSAVPYTCMHLNPDRLKTDSALYRFLNDELAKADPPNLQPATTTPIPRATRPVISASVSSSRPTTVVTTAPLVASTSMSASASVSTVSAVPKMATEPKKATTSLSRAILLMHESAWNKISITNVPSGGPGQYKYTDKDYAATNLQGSAMVIGGNQDDPKFWVELGRLTIINKFGRCLHCSGAAIYSLVMEPMMDGYIFAVRGNSSYDHHYVMVGTEGDFVKEDGYIIDIWDANLNSTTPVSKAKEYRYAMGKHKTFCVFLLEERAKLREFALSRPKPKEG